MSVTATNLIQGPATLYTGLLGATEPASIATAPGVGWTDVGGTTDGVEFGVSDEWANLAVDQIMMAVGATRTGREVTIKTNLAEATLTNLANAISNTAPSANVLNADDGVAAFQAPYRAVLLDGVAPGGFRRRIIIRKVLQTDSVALAYKKDGMTVIPVSFMGFWVSASVAAFKIEDATS